MKSKNEKLGEKETKEKSLESIIKSHLIFSMTAGAIPIPLVDFVAISAIQLDMIKQITSHYSIDYDSNKGKSLVSSIIGTSLAKLGASAIKAIPGVGTLAGISAQVIFAGASTYALGKVFENHFSNEGSLIDVNLDSMKKLYSELLEKGKDIARNLTKETKKEDVFKTIDKLNDLKNNGAITEKDYEMTKKKLLEKIVS